MTPIRSLDAYINRTTMYRILVYSLVSILACGFFASVFGQTSFPPTSLALSIGILIVATFGTNALLSRALEIPSNHGSTFITALILACVTQPPETMARMWGVVVVGVLAIGSKYLFSLHKQHIFNPAALAVLVVSVFGIIPVTWWVATPVLVPVTLIAGLIVVRKTRKMRLVGIFLAAACIILIISGLGRGEAASDILSTGLASWPVLFFGAFMLTEPMTMPSEESYQWIFGGLVGALFASQLSIGPLSITPQLALLVGNGFAFLVNPRGRYRLALKSKQEIAPHTFDFSFGFESPEQANTFRFIPGQYLDWTLPQVRADSRGNRRTFTIASSPTEHVLHLGVKFSDPSSAFKSALIDMKPGDHISTSRLSGHFVLPQNTSNPIVCIAGGIGITPFRSMAKHAVDTKTIRDVTLFHCINTSSDAVYEEVFKAAADFGWKTRYIVREGKLPTYTTGWKGELTADILADICPYSPEQRYYISGPPPMVDHYVQLLMKQGCKRSQIITDFFSGY